MRFFKRDRYFIHLLFTNLLVCMLIFVLIAPLCFSFYHSFYQRERENYEADVRIMLDDLNANIGSICTMAAGKGFSTDLERLCSIHGLPAFSATYNIKKAQQYVSALSCSNGYISDCVVSFANNSLLLSKQSVFYSPDEFFNFYELSGSDFRQFIGNVHTLGVRISCLPADLLLYDKKSPEKLAFCLFVPFNLDYAYGGYFLFIRESALISKLPDSFLENGSFSLYDNLGRRIYTYGIAEPQNAVALEVSSGSGSLLSASAAIESASLIKQLSGTVKLLYVYILSALLVVVLLALFFAKRQSKPVNVLLEQLRSYGYTLPGDKDQMDFVIQSISDMQTKNNNITATLNASRSLLTASQLDRLLLSGASASIPASDLIREPYRLAYAYLPTETKSQESMLLGALIAEQLTRLLPEKAIVHQIEETVFVLLLPASIEVGQIRDAITRVNAQLPQPLCVTLSGITDSPEAAHDVYESARLVSLTQGMPGCFLLAEQQPAVPEVSLNAAYRLNQDLLLGNEESACQTINSIMNSPSMPFESLMDVYTHCRLMMRFAIRDAGLSPKLSPPVCSQTASPATLHESLLAAARAICEAQRAQIADSESARNDEVLLFIENNLNEPALNVETVASHFGVSERNIQRIIHERFGISFAAFLQNRRMEIITHLLSETDLPVAEISAKAGYSTLSAFYKAFKRVYDMTPSEYRAAHIPAGN